MLQFILKFVLLLVVCSISINGWYNITRGRWDIQPDGTKKWGGKIFNFWGKFLQQHTITLQYYSGDEFLMQFSKIREFFKDDEIYEIVSDGIIAKPMNAKKAALLMVYAKAKGLNIILRDHEKTADHMAGTSVSIYKEIYNYKVPYLLRYPLGECVSCMASFYGTICWLFFYFIMVNSGDMLLIGFSLFNKIGLWVVFVLGLSYLNELVFNFNHHQSK